MHIVDYILGIISISSLLFATCMVTRIMRPQGMLEAILFTFPVFSGAIILIGYFLSWLNRLNSVSSWALMSVVYLAVVTMIVFSSKQWRELIIMRPKITGFHSVRDWFFSLSKFEKFILVVLSTTTVIVGFLNLLLVIFTAPHSWDAMVYHLARVAYYYQHGNLQYYDANSWAQAVHPRNSTLLLLYTLVVSDLNENLTQLVQYFSYWINVITVYGIVRKFGYSRSSGLFTAFIFALLPACLMDSTTSKNDTLLSAFVGLIVYFFVAFKEGKNKNFLILSALCANIAFGIKASFLLALPSLFIFGVYAFHRKGFHNFGFVLKDIGYFLAILIVFFCLFVLHSGYLENYAIYKNPFGPTSIRKIHSFEDLELQKVISIGTKNLFRFGLDSYSLDGFPRIDAINNVQSIMRKVPIALVKSMGLDIEKTGIRWKYDLNKMPRADEDYSWWGIFGFGFIWIIVLLSLIGIINSQGGKIFALASVIFVLTQCYSGPYDPWRGRYFIIGAVFAVPTLGFCLQNTKNVLFKIYLICIVIIGCAEAFSSVIFRDDAPIFSIESKWITTKSVFTLARIGQLSRNRIYFWYEPLKKFDEMVPRDAVVAVYLHKDYTYEYPLFGEKLTRTIIPINSFFKGKQPIPENAEYLLYFDDYPDKKVDDIFLGEKFYLRKLKK